MIVHIGFYPSLSSLLCRFVSLSHQQKCAITMIKNYAFLCSFLKTYHQWNPSLLYHIYQHRKIPNYLSKNIDPQMTKLILSYFCIAWLDQPVCYFNIDPLESQTFFQKFITWMDKVSNNKVFEYAHKIKDKLDPQENILWFTDKSFQSLQAWFLNQLQKQIIKNYYNKNNPNIQNHQKLMKLRQGLITNWNSSYGCKKQLQLLLCTKICDTKNKDQNDYKEYQYKVKIYEDHYYQQISLLLDYEKQEQNQQNTNMKKKKRKQKKKNKKKQNQQEIDIHKQNKQQQKGQQQVRQIYEQKNIDMNINQHQNQNQKHNENQNQDNTTYQNQLIIQKEIQERQKQMIKICQFGKCEINQVLLMNNDEDGQDVSEINIKEQKQPIVYKQKSLSENSGQSGQWSNVQTTKTTKKSGHSHPQFNQSGRISLLKAKRSLSPEQSNNSISKLKRKQKGQKKKCHPLSSWNADQSLNQNFLQRYDQQQHSSYKQQQQEYKKSNPQLTSQQDINNNQIHQSQYQCQKKKKKKVNKIATLLRQLQMKMSTSLLNRQLNNFIDSLSIETNNLYDHKIVAFQRVRFFIQTLFPTSQAILFGSNAVGLSLPTSDIDIMLFNLPCVCREQAMEILAHLAVQINTMGWIVSCSTYLNAKVPLVKLQIDPTIQYIKTKRKCDYHLGSIFDPRLIQHLQLKNKKDSKQKQKQKQKQIPINNIIKVDLTINITQQGFLGAQSTQLMKNWMNRYPQIHMCILAFKYILAQRGFSSNFKGGIGSYCLFVMVAAYIQEFPELENLEDGEFFISTLKFYGEDFQNQIKSIILRPLQQNPHEQSVKKSCFISLQQTLSLIQRVYPYQPQSQTILYNIQTNPLRIFDPINNRIMSGSCHLYPQIKSQFRRIYKQLQHLKQIVQKQIELTIVGNEIQKMLENKKTMDKWLNKYQSRNRVSVKEILDGGF